METEERDRRFPHREVIGYFACDGRHLQTPERKEI